MVGQQQFVDIAENCDDYYSIHKGMITCANLHKSCINCHKLKSRECERGLESKSTLIQEHF